MRFKSKCERCDNNGCYYCCELCNYDLHACGGCGLPLEHNGSNLDGTRHEGCTD